MKRKIFLPIITLILLLASCNKLDRPNQDIMDDNSYWQSETNIRLFANGFYTNYFPAHGTGYSGDYCYYFDDFFNDVLATEGDQPRFANSVPATSDYWSFTWVRKANIYLDRIDRVSPLTGDIKNHWMGVARLFRAMEYSRLVQIWGDIPWYDKPIPAGEKDLLYKARDNRAFVMEKVMEDFRYASNNIRIDDGVGYVNRYIAAAFMSRAMLNEASWQEYHVKDMVAAKKFYEAAIEACNLVIGSNKYAIEKDIRTLFGSDDLKGDKESIMFREYNATTSVYHSVASYNNDFESQVRGLNHLFVTSLLDTDGKPQGVSTVVTGTLKEKYSMPALVKKVDPRFGMTVDVNIQNHKSPSGYYLRKFIARSGVGSTDKQWNLLGNVTDAPVIRYAEVLLNFIEAKAELAELGGAAITQSDIDLTINKLRQRPLDAKGIVDGLKKLPDMTIGGIVADPKNDIGVSNLIWEIRRERMIELLYEAFRLPDLKRWKTLKYMDTSLYPEALYGVFYNLGTPGSANGESRIYKNSDGTIDYARTKANTFFWNGTRIVPAFETTQIPSDYEGLRLISNKNRDEFTDKSYLSPLPKGQIDMYKSYGYKLSQNKGWENL